MVQQLRLDPVRGSIEATIIDGTGVLVARWHLHRPTPQLAAAPGTGLVLEGIPILGDDGQLIMDEPHFETTPFPDVA